MQARQAQSHAAVRPVPASWQLYFPDATYVAEDRRALLITELLDALKTQEGWSIISGLQQTQHEYVLQLDYQQLLQLCDSPDLAAALEMQPLEGLACLEAAVHEVRTMTTSCRWTHIRQTMSWNIVAVNTEQNAVCQTTACANQGTLQQADTA